MKKETYRCGFLQWDTDYFDVKSARVDLYEVPSKSEIDEIMEYCKDYEFVTISNANNQKGNNEWIGKKTNAFLVDLNIQYCKTVMESKKTFSSKFEIANCMKENTDILAISKKAFIYSRFLNDDQLPFEKAKNIYYEWTKNAFAKEEKYFVLARRTNSVIGYILFSCVDHNIVIELIAIDESYRKKGIGHELIACLENFAYNSKVDKICVGTQVNNIAANNFYTSAGFSYISNSSTYHMWK